MASPSEDRPKKERDQSSDTSQNHPPEIPTCHPPLPTNHTPETGCATVMGYPHPNPNPQWQPTDPQPYHGYPYVYAQPPPAAYYPSESCHSPMSGFLRGCLMVMIAFVFLSFVTTVMVWLIQRPALPVFRVDTFSVSNFNASSNTDFTASWDAKFTVENPNHKVKVYINRIDSFMFYRENMVSSSLKAEPLILYSSGHIVLHVNLSTKNSDDQPVVPVVDKWVVEDMGRDRNGGTVSFNFRMLVSSTFKSDGWWTRGAKLKVFCDSLKVGFVGATGNGLLPPETPRVLCSVSV
jgi:hypothetical protein